VLIVSNLTTTPDLTKPRSGFRNGIFCKRILSGSVNGADAK
jgi:hypothetical protein